MLIALGILIWILCGLLAVFIMGKVDKALDQVTDSMMIPVVFFVIGPIGLLVTVFGALIAGILLSLESNRLGFIEKIYKLGSRDEKN